MYIPECEICYAPFTGTNTRKEPKNLTCGHCICLECTINLYYLATDMMLQCPFCRAYMDIMGSVPQEIPSNLQLVKMIDSFTEKKKNIADSAEKEKLKNNLSSSLKKKKNNLHVIRRNIQKLKRSRRDYNLKGEKYLNMKLQIERHYKTAMVCSKIKMKRDLHNLKKVFKQKEEKIEELKQEAEQELELAESIFESLDRLQDETDENILEEKEFINSHSQIDDEQEQEEALFSCRDKVHVVIPEINFPSINFSCE